MVELMTLLNKLDSRELQIYNAELQSKKKSTGLAYVLWFFFGSLGIHRAYLDEGLTSFAYFLLFVGGWCFLAMPPLIICFFILGIMLFFDIFLLTGAVQKANDQVGKNIAVKLINSRPPPPSPPAEQTWGNL